MAIDQAGEDSQGEGRVSCEGSIELHIQTQAQQVQANLQQIPSSEAFQITTRAR